MYFKFLDYFPLLFLNIYTFFFLFTFLFFFLKPSGTKVECEADNQYYKNLHLH